MRTALYLTGPVTKWELCQDNILSTFGDDIDIFVYTYGNLVIPQRHKHKFKIIHYVAYAHPISVAVHDSLRESQMMLNGHKECCKNRMIYEKKNNFEYDIIINSRFNDIFMENPTKKGCYISNSLVGIVNCTELCSYQIVSDSCVKYNNKILFITDLDSKLYNELLQQMFGGSVCLSNYITIPKKKLNKNTAVFVIPNTIHTTTQTTLFGGVPRTVFPPSERLKQVKYQLKTIEKYVPEAVVCLLELSELNFGDIYELSKVDLLVLYSRDPEAFKLCNVDPNKSKAEMYILNSFLKQLFGWEYGWFVIMGGRYFLTYNFKITPFLKDKPVIRVIPEEDSYDGLGMIETILYSFPSKYDNIISECLEEGLIYLEKYTSDIEHVMFSLVRNKNIEIIEIPQLNSCGFAGPSALYNAA
jgi:hypothetical protein